MPTIDDILKFIFFSLLFIPVFALYLLLNVFFIFILVRLDIKLDSVYLKVILEYVYIYSSIPLFLVAFTRMLNNIFECTNSYFTKIDFYPIPSLIIITIYLYNVSLTSQGFLDFFTPLFYIFLSALLIYFLYLFIKYIYINVVKTKLN